MTEHSHKKRSRSWRDFVSGLAPKLLPLYPPYLGAGIRARRTAEGYRVRMKLTFYNRNYVGTHFGGSIYSMCDPFFMLLLIEKLGRDYIVWDKAAHIRFLRPGRKTLEASFTIADERLQAIREAVARDGKTEPVFEAEVRDSDGELVALVEKVLYVRPKKGELAADSGRAKR